MWDEIRKHFIGLPAQLKVAKLIFRKGFQVREDGRVVTNRIEIAHTQIATEAGVERRAVDNTIRTILKNPQLKRIYTNLRQVCSLIDVAREFGLNIIIFTPENAKEPGIIADVTRMVAEKGLCIRQAFADDPDMEQKPKLTLIIEGEIPPELVNELKSLPGTYSITFY
ncbi:MAG: amino acid-binding protein [Candidatus Bathyarchaeota archaeon]|nr:amino acid-binding protein [Candidatus Bathyarchaeota archaeon]